MYIYIVYIVRMINTPIASLLSFCVGVFGPRATRKATYSCISLTHLEPQSQKGTLESRVIHSFRRICLPVGFPQTMAFLPPITASCLGPTQNN